LSTILERRQLRDLGASLPSNDVDTARLRRRTLWLNFVTANAIPVAMALALVWLATTGLVVLSDFVSLNLVPLIYMLPVILVAAQWGIVPALVAAVAGAAAADFFFFPPLYSFRIHDPRHVIDLALFLFVAVITSIVAARLRSGAETSSRRDRELPSGGTLQAASPPASPRSNQGTTVSLRLPTPSEGPPALADAIND
jgi:K+-sensing histidine kinase KdpD